MRDVRLAGPIWYIVVIPPSTAIHFTLDCSFKASPSAIHISCTMRHAELCCTTKLAQAQDMHSFARTATIKKANCSYNTADGVKGALAENRSNGLPEHCMAFNLPEARCSE